MDEIILTIAAILAITLPPLNVFAAWLLYKASRSPQGKGVKALRDRADAAAVLAFGSILGGILGVNRFTTTIFEFSIVSGIAIVIMLTAIIVTLSIPSLFWLKRFYTDGFRDETDGPH